MAKKNNSFFAKKGKAPSTQGQWGRRKQISLSKQIISCPTLICKLVFIA